MPANTDPSRIPDIVKHVTMRIYAKPIHISAPPQEDWIPKATRKEYEKYVVAFKMAINTLTAQDYVALGATADPKGFITLTGKGHKRNEMHKKDNPSASTEFDELYTATFAPSESRDPVPDRGKGPGPQPRVGVPKPHPLVEYAAQKRVVQRKMQQETEARTLSGRIKTGLRRAKSAVVRRVKRAIHRRPPKGRV